MAKEVKSQTAKRFVLDKSVVIFSPYAIFAFDDNDVFIPLSVLLEMERAAREERGELRANAKEFGILMDELSTHGNLCKGIKLDNGGTLTVIGDGESAMAVTQAHEGFILVTRDPFTRVIANTKGIPSEDYKSDQSPAGSQIYEGRCCLYVSSEEMAKFASTKVLRLAKKPYAAVRTDGESLISTDYKLTVNEYVILADSSNPKHTLLGRFNGRDIVPLLYYPGKQAGLVYGVEPRNVGQVFALDALLAPPSVAPLVILNGPAGTAKTFLSMAAALAQTIDDWGGDEGAQYRRILITRPNTKMDDDIG